MFKSHAVALSVLLTNDFNVEVATDEEGGVVDVDIRRIDGSGLRSPVVGSITLYGGSDYDVVCGEAGSAAPSLSEAVAMFLDFAKES